MSLKWRKQLLVVKLQASNTEDYSDHEIFVVQKETPDNVNLIADTSEGNIQILANQPEISITSRTSKEDLIKVIDISISKVSLKYAEYIPELQQLCIEFIDIFGINYKDLKISNVLQFDIDTRDIASIYCKLHLLLYKYKQFIKDELDAAVTAGTIEGAIKEPCHWRFSIWVIEKPKTNEL